MRAKNNERIYDMQSIRLLEGWVESDWEESPTDKDREVKRQKEIVQGLLYSPLSLALQVDVSYIQHLQSNFPLTSKAVL